ncbi:unnamed protein product [Aphis gossypii]|uniref:IPT/TIG domain-containing protein n=1 Tax=Aphis gossypii TaxID=80765 RepID=A0A9P0IZ85_APHGO|nr:unnamed protein product [Aphis gossypii]
MANYFRKLNRNKNYVNHYSLNGLLVLVYTMTLMFETHGSSLETESNNTSCSNEMTCNKCTVNAQCSWFLAQQKCEENIFKNVSTLIASKIEECPQFKVNKKYEFNNLFIDLKYIIKVSNDLVGFMNYLRISLVHVRRSLMNNETIMIDRTNDDDLLKFSIRTYKKFLNKPSITEFIFIEFNNVMLRFDNVVDHYATIYNRYDNVCIDGNLKFCKTCAWNYNGYFNYLKWCSRNNICEGRNQQYLKHKTQFDLFKLTNNEAYVTNNCPEFNVTAVNPLSGPDTGGTALTITVKNNWILLENQTITVKVAGTACTNLRLSRFNTITCTTSPWVNTPEGTPALGPILVKYWSDKGATITIESSQRFQFIALPTCGAPSPVLDADQQLRGLESGDTIVPVRGVHFVKPCVASSARLFVVLPNGTMQFASSYCDIPVNDTYMVCRSPRVERRVLEDGDSSVEGLMLNFGLNMMNFIGNQSLSVGGPSHGFHVLFDPMLLNFDVINSTGSVIFYGRYLNHLQSDVILIQLPNSSATDCESAPHCEVVVGCKNVTFSQQHITCEPNVTIVSAATSLAKISVTISDSLSYTVLNRSPSPDSPNFSGPNQLFTLSGWFQAIIALFTSSLIVCTLVCCLKSKNRYDLTKTVGYPLVASMYDTHTR